MLKYTDFGPKLYFHGWVGVGGWLDQVGIRLTQLSTGLKVEAELGKKS